MNDDFATVREACEFAEYTYKRRTTTKFSDALDRLEARITELEAALREIETLDSQGTGPNPAAYEATRSGRLGRAADIARRALSPQEEQG